jgi:hypothetical protein
LNWIKLLAEGPKGTETSSKTVEVVRLKITIDYPTSGAQIDKPFVNVRGTYVMPEGLETGITVNGVSALVYGNKFVANHVPSENGANNINITGTTSDGYVATASTTVNADTSGEYIKLTPDEESGVAPFETDIKLDATFNITATPGFTYSGPDSVIFINTDEANKYTASMTNPGLYYINASLVNNGTTYTDTVAILVMDETMIDTMLKAKWNGMKTSLNAGDVNTALNFIAKDAKEAFEYNLNLLSAYLPEISTGLSNITISEVNDGIVEYEMLGTYEGETYNTPVRFVKDKDGIWRIAFF